MTRWCTTQSWSHVKHVCVWQDFLTRAYVSHRKHKRQFLCVTRLLDMRPCFSSSSCFWWWKTSWMYNVLYQFICVTCLFDSRICVTSKTWMYTALYQFICLTCLFESRICVTSKTWMYNALLQFICVTLLFGSRICVTSKTNLCKVFYVVHAYNSWDDMNQPYVFRYSLILFTSLKS